MKVALGKPQEDSDRQEEKESCREGVFPGEMSSRGGRVVADEGGADAETNQPDDVLAHSPRKPGRNCSRKMGTLGIAGRQIGDISKGRTSTTSSTPFLSGKAPEILLIVIHQFVCSMQDSTLSDSHGKEHLVLQSPNPGSTIFRWDKAKTTFAFR